MKKREMALAIQQVVDDAEGTDFEKLAAAFDEATSLFIAGSEHELALARALADEETAVKEQIKGNVMRAAREIFGECYTLVSGERGEKWNE